MACLWDTRRLVVFTVGVVAPHLECQVVLLPGSKDCSHLVTVSNNINIVISTTNNNTNRSILTNSSNCIDSSVMEIRCCPRELRRPSTTF